MSFNAALSGLQAATVDLSVTSNNIANVATTGFKNSRTEFGDLFELSPFGNTSTQVGSGVEVLSVSQQFDQGNLKFTDASLDMAISGQGFFITNKSLTGSDISYTRAGQFRVPQDHAQGDLASRLHQGLRPHRSGRGLSPRCWAHWRRPQGSSTA